MGSRILGTEGLIRGGYRSTLKKQNKTGFRCLWLSLHPSGRRSEEDCLVLRTGFQPQRQAAREHGTQTFVSVALRPSAEPYV